MDLENYTKEKVFADLKRLQYLYRMKEVIRYDHERGATDTTESVAEHVYGMLLLTEYFLPLEDPEGELNRTKMYQMILFHDIDEIETGDIIGYKKTDEDRARELEGMKYALKNAPENMQDMMTSRVEEYEGRHTRESQFAKAIDKIEPLVQIHNDKWRTVIQNNKTTAEESERIKLPYIQNFSFIKQFATIIHQDLIEKDFYWTPPNDS